MKQPLRLRFECTGSLFLLILLLAGFAYGQAGRRSPANGNDEGGSVISVIAMRGNGSADPIKIENIALYENSIEQRIKGFSFDPSPSRIVLLVDNSQTLRTDVAKMKDAAQQFAYEIYDGDQLFVAAYDEKAEIIQEWTDDPKKIEKSLETFRKKGNPFLFDALGDVLDQIVRPLIPGTRKTAVVIISDGLDRGSRSKDFDRILAELQQADVAVYALQIPDRTGGAYRRDSPKPEQVIQKLAEGTGGKVFDFAEPQISAKAICDELRKNRYLLTYLSTGVASLDARRLFLTGDEGITLRIKNSEPPRLK
ncbi:MAG: VWA domain-containing protein [Pyrinomonadaceae bacterium]